VWSYIESAPFAMTAVKEAVQTNSRPPPKLSEMKPRADRSSL